MESESLRLMRAPDGSESLAVVLGRGDIGLGAGIGECDFPYGVLVVNLIDGCYEVGKPVPADAGRERLFTIICPDMAGVERLKKWVGNLERIMLEQAAKGTHEPPEGANP